MGRGADKPPVSDEDEAACESPSFGFTGLEDELLAGLDTLGPRDIHLLATLLAKVRSVEQDLGEDAACAMIDTVVAILEANRPRG